MGNVTYPSHSISLERKLTLRHMSTAHHAPDFHYDAPAYDSWRLHLHFTEIECDFLGHTYVIPQGCATLFPPHQFYRVSGRGESRHIWHSCHFGLPSESDSELQLPIVINLGLHFGSFDRIFHQSFCRPVISNVRSEVAVWEMLWQIADLAGTAEGQPHQHPTLERAVQCIEQRLHEPFAVSALAQELAISHNQLTRLFQAAFGQTVISYVRERRVRRAEYLLTHTDLPLKVIAVQVGLLDPHSFNKAVRRVLGVSPSSVRR
jgi:AraC family transcriptional regulator